MTVSSTTFRIEPQATDDASQPRRRAKRQVKGARTEEKRARKRLRLKNRKRKEDGLPPLRNKKKEKARIARQNRRRRARAKAARGGEPVKRRRSAGPRDGRRAWVKKLKAAGKWDDRLREEAVAAAQLEEWNAEKERLAAEEEARVRARLAALDAEQPRGPQGARAPKTRNALASRTAVLANWRKARKIQPQ